MKWICRCCLFALCATLRLWDARATEAPPPKLIDDREITLWTETQVEERRRQLIHYIWGEVGFPGHLLPNVRVGVRAPVSGSIAAARVDEFTLDMAPGLQGLAYHFIPTKRRNELVVLHHGHACTLDDDNSDRNVGYGMQRTIAALLENGYGVLGVFMPHMRPGDCSGGHNGMFTTASGGNPMRYFFEMTVAGLNVLERPGDAGSLGAYQAFHMMGLSGGGWTTTVYAALDTRIRCSISVAGTIPLYLRSGSSIGDREQYDTPFYTLAGYPDLYVMGATGDGRRQVQLLVERDDCCFGKAQHDPEHAGMAYRDAMRDFEKHVHKAISQIGSGSFRVEIDGVAPSHMISHHAIKNIILPALRGQK